MARILMIDPNAWTHAAAMIPTLNEYLLYRYVDMIAPGKNHISNIESLTIRLRLSRPYSL